MKINYPEHCTACPHRQDLYDCMISNFQQLLNLNTDEAEKLNLLAIQKEAADILKDCSFSTKSFPIIVSAITFAALDPTLMNNLKKGLYRKVAVAHQTTDIRVERNLRTSIKKAWTEGTSMQKYFGNTINSGKRNPTNLQFIIIISEKVRERCRLPVVNG